MHMREIWISLQIACRVTFNISKTTTLDMPQTFGSFLCAHYTSNLFKLPHFMLY